MHFATFRRVRQAVKIRFW